MPEIWSLLNLVAGWMERFIAGLARWLQETLTLMVEWLTQSVAAIFNRIADIMDAIGASLQAAIQAIEETVRDFVSIIGEGIDRLWDKMLEATLGVIESIESYVANAIALIGNGIESLLGKITGLIERVAEGFDRLVTVIISRVQTLIESVSATVRRQIESTIEQTSRLMESVTRQLERGIDTLIGGAESLVSEIGERLGDIREGFADAASGLVKAIGEISDDAWKPIADTIKGIFTDVAAYAEPEEMEIASRKFQTVMTEQNPEQLRQWVGEEWMRFRPSKSRFWNGLFFTIMGLIGSATVLFQVSTYSAETMLQEFRRQYPYQILAPADVTGAWRRGLLDTAQAKDMIQRQGYAEPLAETILYLSDIMPPEIDLMAMFHRGLIDEGGLRNALFEKGIKDEMISPLIQASYVLPPVSDIITMAVREVFTPAIAERFGQYEGFPQVFADEAKKQGLTEEWAKRYWAAHWALPSPRQGFEMLHRGVIEAGDLELLLKALDVMPFWRDKLTEIAYQPLTRVDVRRMHKLGILDEAGVRRAYMDLGYNAENAERMVEFTVAYNTPDTADDIKSLDEVSRSTVTGLYRDGVIDRKQAKSLLQGAGFSDEAAELYLHAEDVDIERAARKEEIDNVLEQAKAGILTFTEAQDKLRRLNLQEREIQRAIHELVRVEESRTKLPSRTEAERMVEAGIIGIDEYVNVLARAGYSEKWQQAFATLLKGKFHGS